jgi:hypothetical protein
MAHHKQYLTPTDDIWYTPAHALHPPLPFLEKEIDDLGASMWCRKSRKRIYRKRLQSNAGRI